MFEDDAPAASGRDSQLKALESQDLSPLSLEDLKDRVDRLETEITRTKQAIENKKKSAESAAAIFKS